MSGEDDQEKDDVEFAPGLSPEARADAERIRSALSATRRERHQEADATAVAAEVGAQNPPDNSRDNV
jgi:hypothetical protein